MSEFKQHVELIRASHEMLTADERDKLKASGRAERAYFEIAEAYLAEHPEDDGKPADPEWMEDSGFEDVSWHFSAKRYPIRAGIFVRAIAAVGGWSQLEIFAGDERITARATRGDVRRLCHCLGVELGGGKS